MTNRGRGVLSPAVALWILAILATIWFLREARDLLVPIALGVLISHALEPVVRWLEQRGVGRVVGTSVLMLILLATLAAGAYALHDDALDVMRTLPRTVERARQEVLSRIGIEPNDPQGTPGALKTTETPSGGAEEPARSVNSIGLGPLFARGGDIVVVFFLIFFLLISGPRFRERLFEVAGSDAERRRTTRAIVEEINTQIQWYLLVLLVAAMLVGTATWAVLAWQNVQHAAMWGFLAGLFNSIPYFGPVIVSGGLFVVGLSQGGGIAQAFQISGAALLITSLEGWLLTPALMGKAERMSALVVFLGLVVWTWLWGEWGTILAVPMLVVVKSIADHVEGLKRLGRLMSP